VMTYGYMGHRDPGMGMGPDGEMTDMPGMTGMNMPATTAPGGPSAPPTTNTNMPGMSMPNN
jgi:hypothetical protein